MRTRTTIRRRRRDVPRLEREAPVAIGAAGRSVAVPDGAAVTTAFSASPAAGRPAVARFTAGRLSAGRPRTDPPGSDRTGAGVGATDVPPPAGRALAGRASVVPARRAASRHEPRGLGWACLPGRERERGANGSVPAPAVAAASAGPDRGPPLPSARCTGNSSPGTTGRRIGRDPMLGGPASPRPAADAAGGPGCLPPGALVAGQPGDAPAGHADASAAGHAGESPARGPDEAPVLSGQPRSGCQPEISCGRAGRGRGCSRLWVRGVVPGQTTVGSSAAGRACGPVCGRTCGPLPVRSRRGSERAARSGAGRPAAALRRSARST